MINALIIDDEEDAREGLKLLIASYCPDRVKVLGEADSILKALPLIDKHRPELIFLDVLLGNDTGFELLDEANFIDFELIFITGHSEFAAKAFRYNATDYLLKPIHPDHLIAALDKVARSNPIKEISQHFEHIISKEQGGKLTVNSKDGITFINIMDIVSIQGDGNYSYFFLDNGKKIVVSKNIGFIESQIDNKFFLRVHQSYIFNFKFLHKILYEDGTFVVAADGSKVPISRAKKENVKSFVLKLYGG